MSPRNSEPAPQPDASYVPEVADFDGTSPPFPRFLFQLNFAIRLAPARFPSDSSKSAFLLSLLKGTAQDWAYAMLEGDATLVDDFERFTLALKAKFDGKGRSQATMNQLSALRQGTDSVEEYTKKFRQLAATIKWNELAFIHAFYYGLREPIKEKLTDIEYPETLQEVIDLATAWGERLHQRFQEKKHEMETTTTHHRMAPTSKGNPNTVPELWKDLPEEMRTQLNRMALHQCIQCGSSGHMKRNCPLQKKKELGKGAAQSPQ